MQLKKKSTYLRGSGRMYLYLFVPVLCIRGLKMGWAMGRVWVWVWVWDVGCWC